MAVWLETGDGTGQAAKATSVSLRDVELKTLHQGAKVPNTHHHAKTPPPGDMEGGGVGGWYLAEGKPLVFPEVLTYWAGGWRRPSQTGVSGGERTCQIDSWPKSGTVELQEVKKKPGGPADKAYVRRARWNQARQPTPEPGGGSALSTARETRQGSRGLRLSRRFGGKGLGAGGSEAHGIVELG